MKQFYTTGYTAKMLGVASRTVCKWIDSGKLNGHRLPGSLDRRVRRDDLIAFIKDYNLLMPKELIDSVKLLVGIPEKLSGWTHASLFEAAVILAEYHVTHAIVGDEYGLSEALKVCTRIRENNIACKFVLIVSDDIVAPDFAIQRPCNIKQIGLDLLK